MTQALTRTANGNIVPLSIIKWDTSAEGRVIQSGAGDRSIGIVAPWTRRPPALGMDDGFAAIAGENVTYYPDGAKDVPLQLGGTVTYGDRIKSDGSGFGVSCSTDKDQMIAVARANGVSGEIIPVDVQIGEVSV